MLPAVGKFVLYHLTADDVKAIDADRISLNGQRSGHRGSPVKLGQEFPMLVVEVAPELQALGGRVFLAGTDDLWVGAVHEGIGPGTWTLTNGEMRRQEGY